MTRLRVKHHECQEETFYFFYFSNEQKKVETWTLTVMRHKVSAETQQALTLLLQGSSGNDITPSEGSSRSQPSLLCHMTPPTQRQRRK